MRMIESNNSIAQSEGQVFVQTNDEMKFHVKIEKIDRMTRLTDNFIFDNFDFCEINFLFLRFETKSIEKRIRQNFLFARWSNCHDEKMIIQRSEYDREVKKIICIKLWLVMIRWNNWQANDVLFSAVRCKHYDLTIICYLVIQYDESCDSDDTIEHSKCNDKSEIWLKFVIKNLDMTEEKFVN